MAMFWAQYSGAQNKQVLVPGVPDKIILVTRVWMSANKPSTLKLYSDPLGPREQQLTPALWTNPPGVADLNLGRDCALATGRGAALGLTTTLGGTPEEHSIMVWYEVVN